MLRVATGIFAVATAIRLWIARNDKMEIIKLLCSVLIGDIKGLVALIFSGGLLYDNVSPQSTFVLSAACVFIAGPMAVWKLHTPKVDTVPGEIPEESVPSHSE
jgi:hypothetical protein